MTADQRSEALGTFVTLDKGKPPLIQQYDGPDAEVYLTPEYLRGRTSAELVKPALKAVRVADGETIVLWDGSNAGEIFRAKRGILASTMSRIRTNGHFKSDYFYYALKGWEEYLKGQTSGSGIPHVDKEVLGKLTVLACDEDEQSKIAEILSTVDQAIEQTVDLIAKQQRIKIGLMQDLLTRGIDEQGNLRSEETHQFKDSSLGRIPVEWEVDDVESLLADVDPPMRSGPFGSSLLKDELVESGVPYLGIDNVFPERFVRDFKRFVTSRKAKQLQRYRVRPGDLMITIMGTVGRCCVVPNDIGEALSSKHVWTISLDKSRYSPFVACLQINHSPWVLNHFAKDEQGGIMASIRSETLRSTRLPVPPPDELGQIETCLRGICDDLSEKERLLEKLSALKTALMQDLLTGEKRVTPLLEPAQENVATLT